MKGNRLAFFARLGLTALTALTIAGCSVMDVLDRRAEKAPTEATPPYHVLIKRALEGKIRVPYVEGAADPYADSAPRAQFNEQMARELSELEVSLPEFELSHVGWAWKSCLRANYRQSQVKIAFFMKGDKILDTRMNVAVDCADAKYEPLS